ncbi:sec-independent protein translocase protein TatB [Steroidobacter agaridevorans]|uniref:Sec-independent protein translocase protein TatB n=1 Tax=Steroidobacter agaridevorans TaxID=2695856 RepID=A0A829Y5C9_9GAMM|nr:Sec-independent protein translocase protein TatB [Steroidobacter agaridevorans]GFE78359.1 sec-independent protein translocase protein TatB [Steroidobacter agaridevorans]GFE89709.1 sec-independent protein translocase protein TatB [Steroidobacter agaridevorans]
MFEVGFTEIVLILGLALLVLGPEKLPGLAEKVGRWTGRARAMARQLRTQLEQEVSLDEMAKSRPMQSPPPASPPPPTDTATPAEPPHAETTVNAEAAAPSEPQPASDQPHNASGLDLQTMVSGMEPPPQSAAETPATKAVQ